MPSKNPLVLTIDLGTQSTRAFLIDKDGNILHKASFTYEKPYYSLNPGWAEQKPEVYWDAVCNVTNRVKEDSKEQWNDIIAVTVTTIRDTCLCVNKEGAPLRDVIVWLDKRQAKMSKPVSFFHTWIYKLIGMMDTVTLQRKVSACNWIMENEPDVWRKTHKFIFISGYLTFLLTGRLADSVANMIGHIPFSSKTRKWMSRFDLNRPIFDIHNDKLTELLEPGKTIGYISEAAAAATGIPKGLPLVATGSDIGCETLGLSCLKPDSAAINFGTTATIQFTINKYMEPLPFIPAYPAVLPKHYNPEVQVYRGYWLISWFKKEFAAKEVERAAEIGVTPEAILEKMLKKIPAGCDGLVFQPYFTPGVIMPKSKGSIVGFSDIHTRAHLYRAIIEGINFALMDGLYTMQKRGRVKIKKIFLGGGGSQSDTICQITANMFGLPTYRTHTYEATGLGSSMVAFVAMGIHKDINEAASKMVRIKDEFKPDLNEHKLYKYLFKDVFSKVFDKLLPLYKTYEEHINV
jgi:sugar (pentulose or hexulose) kinase